VAQVWRGTVSSLKFDVDTFGRHRQLAALDNLHRLDWLIASALLNALNLGDDVVALEDLAENYMASVEPSAQDTLASSSSCLNPFKTHTR
jgi:hypothetical protein